MGNDLDNRLKSFNRPWHALLVDFELLNPTASRTDAARYFNKTPEYISMIRNTDMYREYRAQRVAHLQAEANERILDLAQGTALTGLEVMKERIEQEREDIGLGVVRECTETAFKALGFGARQGGVNINVPGQGATVTIGAADQEDLRRAREELKRFNEQNTRDLRGDDVEDAEVCSQDTIDAEAEEVSGDKS